MIGDRRWGSRAWRIGDNAHAVWAYGSQGKGGHIHSLLKASTCTIVSFFENDAKTKQGGGGGGHGHGMDSKSCLYDHRQKKLKTNGKDGQGVKGYGF